MSDIKKITIGSDELYAFKTEQVNELPSSPDKNTLYILNPSASSSGTSLDLDLSRQSEIVDFNLFGESHQEGTPTPSSHQVINSVSGGQIVKLEEKNLYVTPESTINNGITYVLNEDGSYNISGTASGEANCLTFSTLDSFEDGETYTLSANQELPKGFEILLEAYNGTTWVRHALGNHLTNNRQTLTAAINISGSTRMRYVLRMLSGYSINISNLKIQLEKSSIATSYEKYVDNYFNLDLNEELFDPDNYLTSAVYVGSNGYQLSSVSGNSVYIECKPNTTYVVKKSEISTTYQNCFGIWTTAKTPTASTVVLNTAGKNSGDDSSLEYEITTPGNAKYLGVFCILNNTTDTEANIVQTLSIKEVDKVELRGVEDKTGQTNIRDYIYKKEDSWYIRRYTDTFTLTGGSSENWYMSDHAIKCNSIVYTVSSKCLGAREFNEGYIYSGDGSTIRAYCDSYGFRFKSSDIYRGISTYEFALGKIDSGGGNSSIYISNPDNLTIAQWVENLQTNPMTVMYAVKEPFDEKITRQSLIDELDKITNLIIDKNSDKFTNSSSDSIAGNIKLSFNEIQESDESKWIYHNNEWKKFDSSYTDDKIQQLLEKKVDKSDYDVVNRYYRSLVPVGKRISASKNLNTVEFLEVGKYYNNKNVEVATMTNCPTTEAFMMEVFSPLSQDIDNETTTTYVYRVRKVMDYKGNSYTQNVQSSSTAGVFTYGSWVKDTSASDISNFNNKYGYNKTRNLTDNRWVKIAQLSHSSSSNDNLSYTFRLDYCTSETNGVRQSFKFGIGSRLSNTSMASLKYQLLSSEKLVYTQTDYDFANNVKVIYKYTSGSPHKIELQIWTKSDAEWTSIYLWPCQESYKGDFSISLANSTDNDEWTYYKEYNTNKQSSYSQSGFSDVTFEDKSKRYWANVEISESSSTTISPTFSKIVTSGSTYPHIAGDGTNLILCPTTDYTANNGAIVLDKTHLRPSITDSSHIALGMESALWTHLYMSGDIYHGSYQLTLPNKAGTVALTSDLPTVNDATLTIQKNGTNVQTFSANQSTDVTANIEVPTKVSDLTNDVGGNSYTGTCSTAAATAAKAVTISSDQNFVLNKGAVIGVKFTYTNTAENPTIEVNNTGAKSIWFNTAAITTGSLNKGGYANSYTYYIYDGTYWVWLNWGTDDNTTYSSMSVAEGTAGTATSQRVVRADYLKQIIQSYVPSTYAGSLITDNSITFDKTVDGEFLKLETSSVDPGDEGFILEDNTLLAVYDVPDDYKRGEILVSTQNVDTLATTSDVAAIWSAGTWTQFGRMASSSDKHILTIANPTDNNWTVEISLDCPSVLPGSVISGSSVITTTPATGIAELDSNNAISKVITWSRIASRGSVYNRKYVTIPANTTKKFCACICTYQTSALPTGTWEGGDEVSTTAVGAGFGGPSCTLTVTLIDNGE